MTADIQHSYVDAKFPSWEGKYTSGIVIGGVPGIWMKKTGGIFWCNECGEIKGERDSGEEPHGIAPFSVIIECYRKMESSPRTQNTPTYPTIDPERGHIMCLEWVCKKGVIEELESVRDQLLTNNW